MVHTSPSSFGVEGGEGGGVGQDTLRVRKEGRRRRKSWLKSLEYVFLCGLEEEEEEEGGGNEVLVQQSINLRKSTCLKS